MSEIEGGNARARLPVKWRDKVQECVRERGRIFEKLSAGKGGVSGLRKLETLLPWPYAG